MTSNQHRIHLTLPPRQYQFLNSLSERTQLGISEMIRTMIDRFSSEDQLNATYPTLSGTFQSEGN